MKNEIVEYVKDEKGNLIGCVVSKKVKVGETQKWNVGFSILHPHDVDMGIPFNKEYGYMIASRKAEGNVDRLKHIFIPDRVIETLMNVINRSFKYFKDVDASRRSTMILAMLKS